MRQLKERSDIYNPVGILLSSVPQYFRSPASELARYREKKARAEHEQTEAMGDALSEIKKTLADPSATEEDKALARQLLPKG